MESIFGFLIESVLVGFIIKKVIIGLIVGHWLAERIVRTSNNWLDAKPHRRAHYEALLHVNRQPS